MTEGEKRKQSSKALYIPAFLKQLVKRSIVSSLQDRSDFLEGFLLSKRFCGTNRSVQRYNEICQTVMFRGCRLNEMNVT